MWTVPFSVLDKYPVLVETVPVDEGSDLRK